MNHNIAQNRTATLAVSQNRNNIESWPKYRNTIKSLHFCQFPPLVYSGSSRLSVVYSGCIGLAEDSVGV